jgi:hypothetical protein
VLVIGTGAIAFLPFHVNWIAIQFLVVFVLAFKAGE